VSWKWIGASLFRPEGDCVAAMWFACWWLREQRRRGIACVCVCAPSLTDAPHMAEPWDSSATTTTCCARLPADCAVRCRLASKTCVPRHPLFRRTTRRHPKPKPQPSPHQNQRWWWVQRVCAAAPSDFPVSTALAQASTLSAPCPEHKQVMVVALAAVLVAEVVEVVVVVVVVVAACARPCLLASL